MTTTRFLGVLICVGLLQVPGVSAQQSEVDVRVYAVSGLRGALDELAREYERQGRGKAAMSYADSPTLARQIEKGAPADIFISADTDWMDHLAKLGLIRIETRVELLSNHSAAILAGARSKIAYQYLRYLRSHAAQAVWQRHGFEPGN